jgi:hypothetical protein
MIIHTDGRMTVSAFLAALAGLRAAGYAPYVAPEPSGPAIRLTSPAGDQYCPITAVYAHRTGKMCPPGGVYSTIEHLRLSPDDAYALTAAAPPRRLCLSVSPDVVSPPPHVRWHPSPGAVKDVSARQDSAGPLLCRSHPHAIASRQAPPDAGGAPP